MAKGEDQIRRRTQELKAVEAERAVAVAAVELAQAKQTALYVERDAWHRAAVLAES